MPLGWTTDGSRPTFSAAVAMAKRVKRDQPPIELRKFLEEAGLAVRERLAQIHPNQKMISTSIEKDGNGDEFTEIPQNKG